MYESLSNSDNFEWNDGVTLKKTKDLPRLKKMFLRNICTRPEIVGY